MAVPYGSSVIRMEVFESLYLISQATQQIADHLERLKSAKMLAPVFAEIQKLAAFERQAVVAASVVHNLAAPELEDSSRHQHRCIHLEKKLVTTSKNISRRSTRSECK